MVCLGASSACLSCCRIAAGDADDAVDDACVDPGVDAGAGHPSSPGKGNGEAVAGSCAGRGVAGETCDPSMLAMGTITELFIVWRPSAFVVVLVCSKFST